MHRKKTTTSGLIRILILIASSMTALTACGEAPKQDVIFLSSDMTAQDVGLKEDQSATEDQGTTTPTYVFEGEEVACAPNTSYQEVTPILMGGKINPTGRGEQGAVYDPCHKRVVLFGGNDEQPTQCADTGPKNYAGDTWAYSLEHENWYRIKTDIAPSARGRHVTALDLSRKKLFLFGGRFRQREQSSGLFTMYDDLWSFDLNTDRWQPVLQKGDIPSARVNSTMVYDPFHDRLLLFGGNSSADALQLRPLNDTYALDLKTLVWTRINTTTAPEQRAFHTATVDIANRQMLVFSGSSSLFSLFHADIWAFNLDNMSWSRIWNETNGPGGRINAGFIQDPDRARTLLFGGHDDTALGNTNDLWAFDPKLRTWSVLRKGDIYTGAGCASFCSCEKDFVTYDKESPERRQYPTFVHLAHTNHALLFSGTADCGYTDDTWTLDMSSASWTLNHAAEQGIACERTGREDCEELCY